MTTRRDFIKSVPAAGAAFAVAVHMLLDEAPARVVSIDGQLCEVELGGHPDGRAPADEDRDAARRQRIGLPAAQERRRDVDDRLAGAE